MDPGERVRRATELFNRGDLDGAAALFAENVVVDLRPVGLPGMAVYEGRAGYRRFLDEWLEAFPGARLEIESTEQEADRQLVVFRQDARGGAGGVPISFVFAIVSVYRDGELVAGTFLRDLDAARARFRDG